MRNAWSTADYVLSGVAMMVTVALLAVCAWMLYIGVEYHDYECEKQLSLWLVVFGAYGGVMLTTYGSCVVLYTYHERRGSRSRIVHCCDESYAPIIFKLLTFLFATAWMIVGSVWTYEIDPEDRFCPDAEYHLAWYFLTCSWGIIGGSFALFLLGFACVSLYWYCSGGRR